MNQQELTLAAIGDLEVTRRALIMEIQARDEYIKELREKYEPEALAAEQAEQGEPAKNGSVVLPA